MNKLKRDKAFWAGVEDALLRGAWKALDDHRRAGLPLVIWRDGKVTWVSPDEFEKGLLEKGPRPKPLPLDRTGEGQGG